MPTNRKRKKAVSGVGIHEADITPANLPTAATGAGASSVGEPFDDAQQKKLDEMLAEKTKEFTNLIEGKTTDLEDKMETRLSEREVRVMEVLSIFVAVLIFVSTNITIFSRVQDVVTGVWFMIIMAFCTCFIVSILFLAINQWRMEKTPMSKWGVAVPIILAALLLGALFLYPKYDKPLNPAPCQTQQCQ